MFRFDPVTKKRWNRFRSIKRGYYSFVLFLLLLVVTVLGECFVNGRALLVSYEGKLYFPTYGGIIPGKVFGFDYDYETNYRDLQKRLAGEAPGFVVMPLIPWNPYELDLPEGRYPPFPPDFENRHLLGTDTSGRDVLARLFYGFRTAIIFSLLLLLSTYLVGVTIGCIMGYYGGWFDLLFQRLIEIWTNIPYLYVIVIVSSILVANFYTLLGIMIFFGWTSMTWYMRTMTLKEKSREYVLAARALGASPARTIFRHILPNAISVIVTFVPFAVNSGIVGLTSLDYLGFGLPAPTPSWGELIRQGIENMGEAQWIIVSVVMAMVVVLSMVAFIGEAVREAYDPKKYTVYE